MLDEWETVYTQIRSRVVRRLIWDYTVWPSLSVRIPTVKTVVTVRSVYLFPDNCAFDILRKDVYIRRFIERGKMICNWQYPIRNHLSFLFLSFQTLTTQLIKLVKKWKYPMQFLDLFFLTFFFFFFFFSLILKNWCSITILWKFQKFCRCESCWKPASKLPTISIFIYSAAVVY